MVKEKEGKKKMKEEIKRKDKTLTAKEQKRMENLEKIDKELKDQGYERHDLTISLKKANTIGLLSTIPFVIVYLILYLCVFKYDFNTESVKFLYYVILVIILTVIHELIHGLFFGIFTKNHFKDVEFGFNLKEITPYCSGLSYLKKWQYIIVLFMPFFILGIVFTTIILFITSSTLLFLVGITMMLAGSGDLSIIYLIFKNKSKKKDPLYMDHPVDCGVIMYDK